MAADESYLEKCSRIMNDWNMLFETYFHEYIYGLNDNI